MKKIIYLLLLFSLNAFGQAVPKVIANKPSGGTISLDTLKAFSTFSLNQTTASQTISLASFTPGSKIIYVSNIGTVTVTLSPGGDLPIGKGITYRWDGFQWSAYATFASSGSVVSDDVYGAGWNGVTTIAPSKNSVYDKVETLVQKQTGDILFDFPATNSLTITADNGGYEQGQLNISNTTAQLVFDGSGSVAQRSIGVDASGIKLNTASTYSAIVKTDNIASSNKTLQCPNASGTIVLNDNTATLTNKTISGASNTLSNIDQSSVTNLASDLAGKQATLVSGTNIKTVNSTTLLGSGNLTTEVPLTFSTGLTRSTNTITVNNSQHIATLSNLTTNGYVKTSGGAGTLGVSATIPNTDITGLGTLSTQSGTFSGTSSGTNTGDNAVNSLYSGLVSNATHTGDATGSTALTVVGLNGTNLAGLSTGLLKNTTGTGVPSIATAGTDYVAPASLSNYVQKATGTVLFANPSSSVLNITSDNGALAKSLVSIDNSAMTVGYNLAGGGSFLQMDASGATLQSTGTGISIQNSGAPIILNSDVGIAVAAPYLSLQTSGSVATLKATNVTGPIDIECQDASGTLAYLTDIPTVSGVYLPLAGGTMSGGITAGGQLDMQYNSIKDINTIDNSGSSFVVYSEGISLNGISSIYSHPSKVSQYYLPYVNAITDSLITIRSAATLINKSISGSANTLTNIAQASVTNLTSDLAGKQATLVSATNIKTVNGNSLLGSGDLSVSSSISVESDATDADFTAVVNSVKYLPSATLSTNRTITIPAGANGDFLEIYNNETAYNWNLTGASVYLSDGVTTITSLYANTNHLIRKISGKWRILN